MYMARSRPSVLDWEVGHVSSWLEDNEFHHLTGVMCDEHKIDGKTLLLLTENDLRRPPLQLLVLGDIKRLIICINRLRSENHQAIKELSIDSPDEPTSVRNGDLRSASIHRLHREGRMQSESESESDVRHTVNSRTTSSRRTTSKLQPEYTKMLVGFAYMFFAFWMTAFVMTVVHERVPDMDKYPPLPDLILDNLPYIPWAFDMCELCALVLGFIWLLTLFFHKHRVVLLRRMFSLLGTVFILRCVTMLITSLSVPGTHLECAPKTYGDIWLKLTRAFEIWYRFGMSIQGVRTCGDYMFSGHTVVVTILNFLITEYTPARMYWLHTTSWILNVFAVFFILAAHEHYSIDVFVAFYISSRLFLYYHSLANTRALAQHEKRTRIWFPMFSYFESNCDGVVPNEYAWPQLYPQFISSRLSKYKSR